MIHRLLAGVACAALGTLSLPAIAATAASPELSSPADSAIAYDSAVDSFYAARQGAPFWLTHGEASPAAVELLTILHRSAIDGFATGPVLAAKADELMSRARGGDIAAASQAERLLSSAWIGYVQALQRPVAGMTYADSWVQPRAQSAQSILLTAASAPSLLDHVRSVSDVNPFYASLRDAALQSLGTSPDPRVLANLDRARSLPAHGRYVVVDAATAKLWMVEDGRIADSMKVIVGKPSSQTPMLASTIYAATLNPYWNVPIDLTQKLIAPRVLAQGTRYLKDHHYEVLGSYADDAAPVSPDSVDWKGVKSGEVRVKVRQLPGPANSMGEMKFSFANNDGIYLHDSPEKDLFDKDQRDLSNGCVRLEDAPRLGRWLLGSDPQVASAAPEQKVMLPKPVPVFVTYLTAHADGGQLTLADDIYGRDPQGGTGAVMASLR